MEVVCEFYYFKRNDGLAEYTCQVDSVSITQPNTEIKSFKGEHDYNQDNDGIKEIYFTDNEGNVVEFFPKGLLNSFPNLTSISIGNCVTIKNKLEFVSSQLLEPIIKNGLAIVDFEHNTKIDAGYSVYSNVGDYPMTNNISIEQLMELIDKQCSKPLEDVRKVAELWTTGHFWDFKIIVEGTKEFRCHKTVLGSHSSVFAAIFEINLEEKNINKMEIVDFSATSVDQFLGFLYTGSVPDDVNAMELFAMAAKYDVPKLKMLSEKTILKNLCEDNAMEVFNLAHLHSCDDMKDKAFRKIQQMFPGKSLSENLRNDSEALSQLVIAAKKIDEKARAAGNALASASNDYQVKIKDVKTELELLVKSVNENAQKDLSKGV